MKPGVRKNQWLPRTLICLGCLLLLQGVLNAMGIGVRVHVVNKVYNAGTIKAGSIVHHTVRIVSYSLQPVKVISDPSCGCTVAGFDETWIAPLGSLLTTVHVDTSGMSSGLHVKQTVLRFSVGKRSWQETISERFQVQ